MSLLYLEYILCLVHKSSIFIFLFSLFILEIKALFTAINILTSYYWLCLLI